LEAKGKLRSREWDIKRAFARGIELKDAEGKNHLDEHSLKKKL
jgi:hypothetical protein